ncbi:hypothetical protein NQ315_011634 [Exocentrus adspersus]|uniref:Tc1-like transposase DDE domain-containing protein n=1 Tax=Exocentrus adspersus TaxID=1586481 RepID=A0AAV8V8V1_9CUCU|nr:hypothetical protein NQ315_011634 [Exocentrus adspersus]
MNETNFLYWFEHRLLPNLAEPSIIVMDNASYHSTVVNKMPTTASKIADIQEWFKKNGIQYDDTLLKTQLLNIVRLNMPQPVYKADVLAEEHGHCVLHLPPYHYIFNPIEHIWGITKSYYRDHVGTDGNSTEKSIAMWKEALGKATPEIWAKTVQHTEKEIQRWWDREVAFNHEDIPPLILNLDQDDSDYEDLSD